MKRMHTFVLPAAHSGPHLRRLLSLFFGLSLCLLLALNSASARAEDDPPGRVGRLADFNGSVSWWDSATGEWTDAERNRPLTTGDRISTARSGRAELRVGSSVLRLSNNTEVEVLRLDDEKLVFQLHGGSVAVRVRTREKAEETEVITAEARLLPQRAGHYRFDRSEDTTQAGSWRGELRVADAEGLQIGAGQRVELYRQGRGSNARLRSVGIPMPGDGFSEWVISEDQREDQYQSRTVSTRYVSPEMTGAEELDRHGRWEQHPDYGALWLPLVVRDDWAPYRHGRWAWVRPWGWTWIDEAPWGFAPFHYGRWVSWRGRWGWVPGAYVSRPVYAPALVAWVGGGGWGVSVQIGGPTVGWVPLAPREVYRPYYRSTPRYVERVNPAPPYRWRHPPNQVPTGPISYGNQGVPNGVTVVPSDVLVRRQPVSRGAMEIPDAPRGGARQPLIVLPPPAGPTDVGTGPQLQAPRQPNLRGSERTRGPEREVISPVQMAPGGAHPRPDAVPEVRPEARPERRPDERNDEQRDARPSRPDPAPNREDNRGRRDQDRQERPREVQTVPRPERAERPDRPDRPDRPERAERPQRPAEPERVGPSRPTAAPEPAQVPARERTQDRERDRQSQR